MTTATTNYILLMVNIEDLCIISWVLLRLCIGGTSTAAALE